MRRRRALRPLGAGRGRRQRGAALIEAALCTSLVFTLLFGVIEGGLLLSDHSALTGGVRAATRTATTMGNDALSDYAILRQLKRELSALPNSNVDRIVIFKATGPGASVPTACTTALVHQGISDSGTNTYCNVYDVGDFVSASSNFGCATAYPAYFDCGWAPSSRVNTVGSGQTPDYIGVYVAATHRMVTGLFGSTYALSSTAVYPIEPRLLQ